MAADGPGRSSGRRQGGAAVNLKQLEYIVEIADTKNITRAAQKLYITQSALNQQLLKLEKELGAQLFYRSRTDWRLTPVGEVYVETAKEILLMKQDAYRKISDLLEEERGTLSVGFTTGRGIPMFTSVYPHFHQIYPDIEVTPSELSVNEQQRMVARGELDLGFVALRDDQRHPGDRYVDICPEEIFFIAPEGHPLIRAIPPEQTTIDLDLVKDEYYVQVNRRSTLRALIDEIFEKAGYRPKILFETFHNPAIISMVQSGMCCGIMPEIYVRQEMPGVRVFHLPDRPTWSVCACYRADSYVSKPIAKFIELAKEYCLRALGRETAP